MDRRRIRLFVADVEEPRSRRAGDVLQLSLSVAGITALGLVAVPPSGVEGAVEALVELAGGLLGEVAWALVVTAWVTGVVVLVAGVVRRRWRLLRDEAVGVVLAGVTCALLARVVQGDWIWPLQLSSDATAEWFPTTVLALPAVVILTALPHLARPARVAGGWLLVVATIAVVLLEWARPTAALVSVLVATASAAVVHLVFGSPQGRPSLADVERALAILGVEARDLGVAVRQRAGYFTVDAIGVDGAPVSVRVYGRDAHDTQLLATTWRTLWYREAGAPDVAGRRQQVEREAFLTLLAAQSGVVTDRVVTAGVTADGDALLVLDPVGPTLEAAGMAMSDVVVRAAWTALDEMHASGLSHGQVDRGHLVVVDGRVGFIDFRGGDVGRVPDRISSDRAQLLVTSALEVGVEAATRAASAALSPEELAETLPLVQEAALTWRQRSAVREAGLKLDDLRVLAAKTAGIESPELRPLRRVTWGTLLRSGLLVLAFLALASGLAGLDLADIAAEVRDASIALILAGFLIAQATRLSQAVSTLGASPVPLPLGPVYALQLAQSYIGLAIPTAAARIALNVRFFQRHGLTQGSALAIGAIDGFAGFVVQAILLVGLLLLAPVSLDIDVSEAAPSGLVQLVLVVVAVAFVGGVVLMVVPRWRRAVIDYVVTTSRDAVGSLRGIQSPRRIGLLLVGSLGAELLFASALIAFTAAFGFSLGLGEALLINVSVSLLAGLLPIPGGIGVVEGGLTLGLVRAGMPEEAAFAAVVLYRIATFYLPPVWGFFAMRWLERNRHL